MKVIYKLNFSAVGDGRGRIEFEIPGLLKLLHIEEQRSTPRLWVLVDTEDRNVTKVRLEIVGTGHEIPAHLSPDDYFTTFQQELFVWHVFAMREPQREG